jgi:thioredoxin-related protein
VRLSRLLFGALLGLAGLAHAAGLVPAVDLRAEAAQAKKQGGPLIVLFSRHDCSYCETVRRDYLRPLQQHPRYRDQVVVRQVNQDNQQSLIDFQGQKTSHAKFAAGEKIKLVPVVAFYGPEGKRLAAPIVGTRLPDFYPSYLEDGIAQSVRMLHSSGGNETP